MWSDFNDHKMSNISAYCTIGEILSAYKVEKGDFSNNDYHRYIYIITRGLMELSKRDIVTPESVWLTPTSINTLDLPQDCVKPISVDLYINGRMLSIPPNDKIVTKGEMDCAVEQRDVNASNNNTDVIQTDLLSYPPYYTDLSVTPLFGLRGGYSDYYYKWDRPNNRLILEGNIPTGQKVLVIYSSTGVSGTGETLIPREFQEVLIAWLDFRLNTNDSNRMRRYGIELEELQHLKYRFTIDEYKNVLVKNLHNSIGR